MMQLGLNFVADHCMTSVMQAAEKRRKERKTYVIRSLSNVVSIPVLSSDLAPC